MTSPCVSVIVDRDCGKPFALFFGNALGFFWSVSAISSTASVMDARGAVPVLSPNDVETAAQVLCSALQFDGR